MRKLTYYVAATLDGYIARREGQFDFFNFKGDFREAILAAGRRKHWRSDSVTRSPRMRF
jgi:hypothetical protein